MWSILSHFGGPLLLVGGAVAFVAVATYTDPGRSIKPQLPAPDPGPPALLPKATYPAVRQPPAVAASAAGLADADEVIGVVLIGTARAYPLRALGGAPQNHVINDLVGGRPLTVTYCDIGQCVRVFTHPGSEPLAINIAGMWQGEMALHVDGRVYGQRSGNSVDPRHADPFPFEAVEFERTTWKRWREAHPDTDVSVGGKGTAARLESAREPATSPRPTSPRP